MCTCTSTPSHVRLGDDDVVPVVQVVQLTSASMFDGRHALPAAHRGAIIPT
jgi:hypothetical protein